MINLWECEPLKLMPLAFRKDEYIQATSYALWKTAAMILEKIERAGVYASIDLLPEKIVDLLAEELRAQYYDTSLPPDEKGKAVKKALLWHCRAGTVSAVRELTNLVWRSESAKVQEWFEYGSAPYLFRIILGTDMSIAEELIDAFLQALWKVKNTRSHLESITFMRRIDSTLYAGAARHGCGNIVITDVWTGEYGMHSALHSGVGTNRISRIRIREG